MRVNKKGKRAARELFRLCLVDGVLDQERARYVAERVAGSKRRGSLAVLTAFQRQARLEREGRTAVVESAVALAGPVRGDIETKLAQLYGPRIDTSFAENPALIGGVRVRVGSDVYDGSIRARLAAIEARL